MNTAPRFSLLLAAILCLGLAQCGQDPMENYASGVSSFDKGYYEVAIGYLDQAVESGDLPDAMQARALNYRGIAEYKLDMHQDAERDYQNALPLDATFHCPHYNLGDLYVTLQRYDQAADNYTRSLELYPLSPYALFNRHIIRLIQQDYSAALADFQAATRMDPTLGVLFRTDNRAFILAASCSQDVAEPERILAVAAAALETGDHDRVNELLEPLIGDTTLSPQIAVQALDLLAQSALEQAYAARAEELCGKALALNPAPARRAELLYLQGCAALGLNAEDRAEAAFALLAAEPQGQDFAPRVRMAWGDHLSGAGRWDAATEEYTAVIEEYSDSAVAPDAAAALISVLAEQGRLDEAGAVAHYLFSTWPDAFFHRPQDLLAAGDVYAASGDTDAAQDAYAALYNLVPEQDLAAEATQRLADLYAATGSRDRAAALSQALAETLDAPDLASPMIDGQDMILIDPGPFLIPLGPDRNVQEGQEGQGDSFLVVRVVLRVADEISAWDVNANMAKLRNGLWEYLSHEDPGRLARFETDIQATVTELLNDRLEYGTCQGAQLTRYGTF